MVIRNKWMILLFCSFFSVQAYKNHYTGSTQYSALKQEFADHNAWGLHAIIDLKNCNPALIRSSAHIEKYIVELCEIIDMKRFGNPTVVHFGEDERVAGYSMFQLIETSNIAGHFANDTNNAYIDIFSCKMFDPYRAAEFTKEFFKAQNVEIHIVLR